MWIDSERLQNFYKSVLGSLVHDAVYAKLEEIWPSARGENVAGYGFAIPYLGLYDGEAARVISLMPAPQGVLHWPKERPNCSVLIDETLFPIPDQSLDKLLLIHAFEYSDRTLELLGECWRALAEGGELIIATPNRRSAWAQMTNTPLGYGTPYTGHQLYDELEQAGFSPQHPHYCLYTPPSERLFRYRFSKTFEKFGQRFSKKFGGMLLFPAKKQVHALTARRATTLTPRGLNPKLTPSMRTVSKIRSLSKTQSG